jgi:alanine racemase
MMDDKVTEQFDLGGASGIVTIELDALRWNYLALSAMTAPARTAAVVKADAYGLGADHIVPVLFDAGCRDFFVAHLQEAIAVKRLPAGSDARVFVLNGLQPGAEMACVALGIVPVLNSLEQVDNWAAVARTIETRLPALLQVDTGMSRLGLPLEDMRALAADFRSLEGLDILYVMSHLAAAEDAANAQNAAQLAVLREASALFAGIPTCFANSGGIFLGRDYHCALARPGIALYGGAQMAGTPVAMKPVMRLDVAVIQTRTVPAGTRVGYGGSHLTKAERRLATIAAGYADGLPRALSNGGAAYYEGVRLPIAGAISMDSITLDITDLPAGSLKLGSLVELIGPNQTLERLAADAGTISYEILTGLGRRYKRLHRY